MRATASLIEIQEFGREVLVDLEGTFTLRDRYALTLGIENLFDNYPDPGEFQACCGRIYRSDSIVPWQGRLYYAQLGISLH